MKRTPQQSAREKQQQLAREKQQQKAEAEKGMQQQALVKLLAAIVALTGFVLYINTTGHLFALDDYSLILENKSTQKGWAAIGEIFSTSYRYGYIIANDELYRPLSKFLFAIHWEIAPGSALPGHLTNIILYALTGFLLMKVLFNYFQSVTLAFIASLLFIAHPIHTEVVANIKSLDEILSLLFNLLTLNAIYHYSKSLSFRHLLFTFLFFFLALLSKESSVTFLAVFAAAWYFFIRLKWNLFIKPGISTLAAFALFMVIRKAVTGGAVSLSPSAADNLIMSAPDALHRFSTAVYIFGLYIKKLLIPHPLVFDYSFGQIPVVGAGDWRFLIVIFILIVGIFFAIRQFNKKKLWVFGFFSFLAVASIVSNIVIIIGTNMGERLMYAPSLGFCIMLTGFLSFLPFNDASLTLKNFLIYNKKILAITGVIVLLFGIKTISRNPVWADNYSLYSNDVLLSPNSTRTHYYLGNLLIKDDMHKGKSEAERDSLIRKGISELEASVAIFPAFTDAYNQMGVAYWKLKNFDKAKASYEEALKYNPNDATVHNNIGTILFETQNFAEAQKAFLKATQLNPNYSDAFMNLGSVYGTTQQFDKAITAFTRAVTIDPNNSKGWYYLGITYQSMGNAGMAQQSFNRQQQLEGKK